MHAKKHSFTKADTIKVIDLGYNIIKSSGLSFEKFLKTEFPNFNLVKLLEKVEGVFTPTTKFNITRTIYYQDMPPKLRICYTNNVRKMMRPWYLTGNFLNQ